MWGLHAHGRFDSSSTPRGPHLLYERPTLDQLVEVLLKEQRLSWQGGDHALAESFFMREPALFRESPCA